MQFFFSSIEENVAFPSDITVNEGENLAVNHLCSVCQLS